MRTMIQATNLELTDTLRMYTEKKIIGAVHKFKRVSEDPATDIRVEIGKTTKHHKSGNVYFAEVNLTVSGTLLRAVTKHEDLHAAIDKTKDVIGRQIRKYLEK
jgi:ribosomal subunit interface protein